MINRPSIEIAAVTMRLAPAADYHEERDAISHDWVRLLAGLGIVPLLLPNALANPGALIERQGVKRILLTNGDSLGPLEGEAGGPAPSARDILEFKLLDIAVETGMPVLGACRGLQAINAYFSGGLTRDLFAVTGERHGGLSHPLNLDSGACMPEINSFHDQGVMAHQVAPSLRITATSPAGVVEGLEHRSLPIRAVQWHPERAGAPGPLVQSLLESWAGA